MKRLTAKGPDGKVTQPDNTSWANVFWKLAMYEDTGFEPEEIQERLNNSNSDDGRKSGEWVVFKDENGYLRNKCGCCGSPMRRGYKQTHYCPDCGAKMFNSEEA